MEQLACSSGPTILTHFATNRFLCAYYVSSSLTEEYDNNEDIIPLTHTNLEPPNTDVQKLYHFIVFP